MGDREEARRYLNHSKKLEAENKRLNKIISDIEDWGIVSYDEPLLKLIKELRDGKSRN